MCSCVAPLQSPGSVDIEGHLVCPLTHRPYKKLLSKCSILLHLTQRLAYKILVWSSTQTYTLAIQHAYLRIRPLFNNDKKLWEKHTLTFCYLISGVVPAPFDLLTPDFKNVATGQLCLHTLSHKCTPPSRKKWGLETNLCLMYSDCTVGGHAPFPAFSR